MTTPHSAYTPTFGQRPFSYSPSAEPAYAAGLTPDTDRSRDIGHPHAALTPRRSPKTMLFAGAAVLVIASLTFAQAQSQSASPFARKKAKQAWESYTPPTAAINQAPNQAPSQAPYSSTEQSPSPTPQSRTYGDPTGTATMSGTQSSSSFEPFSTQPVQDPYSAQPRVTSAPQSALTSDGAYYPGRANGAAPSAAPTYSNGYGQAQTGGGQSYGYPNDQTKIRQTQNTKPYNPAAQNYNGASPAYGNYGPQSSVPQRTMPNSGALPTPAKRSWKDRLGLRNLATTFSGYIKGGAAGTDRNTATEDGWREDFVGDAALRGEVSAISPGGVEYGIGGEVRAQYDKYRRGFGGRVGDCPPDVAGCASTNLNGIATALRGHTSQFYASGPSDAKAFEYALEGAYVFLRSAYGDVTIGRDDGAAYLFSLGAPTLLAVNASNSSVDYTGLDSVKTVNDASGFSEKIAYVSPRLLGDRIGVGVQIGASYALNARACGVDYCVRSNGKDATGTLAPDLENIIEAGIALDRKFANGFEVEATATYATANDESGFAEFKDLKSFGLGLDLGYHDWKLGGSFLQSNNGLQNGDYTAYDVGLTWKPNNFGISASYGHARDKNVDLTSDQAVVGVSYDFDKFRLGTGVQYIERTVPRNTGGIISDQDEKAMALFVEGGFTF